MVLISYVPCTFILVMVKERYSDWRYFGSLLFVIEARILTLYMVIATNLSPLVGAEKPATMVIITISVLAMSLHNIRGKFSHQSDRFLAVIRLTEQIQTLFRFDPLRSRGWLSTSRIFAVVVIWSLLFLSRRTELSGRWTCRDAHGNR